MLLSIVVLSYNRPDQIERILKNFVSVSAGDFNLIIKDDCSPRGGGICEIVEVYKPQVKCEIVFHGNKENLGYDRNLLDAFSVSNAEYVFLLSDDDYIDGRCIVDLIDVLVRREYKVYFTPYTVGDKQNRKMINEFELNRFHEVIYNSILFSGLIFHRQSVLLLPKDAQFLSSCIYTQVYLASLIVFNEKSFGEAPANILYLGGDGENFFGKNQSAVNKDLLQDRSSVVADLRYQVFLLKVVEKIAEATDPFVLAVFKRQYNIRFIGYLFRVRRVSLDAYFMLIKEAKILEIKFNLLVKLLSVLIYLMPRVICDYIYKVAIKKLRKAG